MIRKLKEPVKLSDKHHEMAGGIILLEMAIVSIIAGYYYHSWWVFGGTLIGVVILATLLSYANQILRGILCTAIGLIWVYIFYNWIGKNIDSTGWKVVLTVLVFFMWVGINLLGLGHDDGTND